MQWEHGGRTEHRHMKYCEDIPVVKELNGRMTLFAAGRPFLMLAGEVHNAGSGGLSYMEENVWPYLKSLNLNTLFVPVAWEMLEPRRQEYDFSFVKGVIEQARDNRMHLVLLWFGLWKNGASDYAPAWMKTDGAAFFRAEDERGTRLNCISPFCNAAVLADAAAFAAMMEFLREFDGKAQTVLMVQVENESGLLGAARDFCEAAEKVFNGPVPAMLEEDTDKNGTWEEVFGEDAGEAMMAWAFARAVERIARAGQAQYPLPMYTNAWIEQYPWRPGTYPCGGPTGRMLAIWKLAAPSLMGIAPDIYLPDMKRVMEEYDREDNPLLIPEARRDVMTASYAIYSITARGAIGYAPFGIEDIGRAAYGGGELSEKSSARLDKETLDALQIGASAYDPSGTEAYLAAAYGLLAQLTPPLLQFRGTGHAKCFIQDQEGEKGALLKFEAYDFLVTYEDRKAGLPIACGGIIELEEGAFLLYGCRCRFEVFPKAEERKNAGILSLEEGEWTSGGWLCKRIRNGDEKQTCMLGDLPGALLLRGYKY